MNLKSATSSNVKIFLSAEEDAEKRLDQFLAENVDFSRTFLQKLIKSAKVRVDGKSISKVAYHLREYQEVSLEIPEPAVLHTLPENIPLDILYEDDDVIVISKPAGMVVHPDETYSSGTLVNALLHYLGTEKLSGIGGVKRPGIVHRLDKDTSGVLIVAKNDKAHRHLSREISERRVTKIYKALVFGKIKNDEFSIDSPITRDTEHRKKMKVSAKKDARNALTHCTLERIFEQPLSSLLTVQIVTGRTHQIRVHLASVGFPVAGDSLYGNETLNTKFFKDFPISRMFLHAESLQILLPNGKQKVFTAPFPQDLERTLEMLMYSEIR
ncbi:RluA family pseudouridine synthase [Candidatus Peregrinibacteria bacterium]|nr:RluA family pseudouridine synthase [Candidatus Peregrinibacteria bacterium]